MAWITRRRVCRSCGSNDLTRYHRRGWMRLFRGSQLLRCRVCRSTILLLRDPDSVEDDVPDPRNS